jgi:hypothetical protein
LRGNFITEENEVAPLLDPVSSSDVAKLMDSHIASVYVTELTNTKKYIPHTTKNGIVESDVVFIILFLIFNSFGSTTGMLRSSCAVLNERVIKQI